MGKSRSGEGQQTDASRCHITAVFKKVVGTHFFFALFGPLGARCSPPPLRQPHGIKVSHIVKLNRAVP